MIVSLAVADLMVACLVMPFGVINEVRAIRGRSDVGRVESRASPFPLLFPLLANRYGREILPPRAVVKFFGVERKFAARYSPARIGPVDGRSERAIDVT